MTFDDIVALLKQSFGLELKVVEGTTVFEVVSEDGGTKVKVLMQNVGEYNKVLLSADLGEPPQGGSEALFRTMLEANNLFVGTAGASLALDSASGREILVLLERINRTYGTTILLVTHNAAIRRMANKVLTIRDGMIVDEAENASPVPAAELEDL